MSPNSQVELAGDEFARVDKRPGTFHHDDSLGAAKIEQKKGVETMGSTGNSGTRIAGRGAAALVKLVAKR